MKKRKRRARKQRRASRAILRNGRAAAPTHKLKSGRTGTAHSKKSPARRRRELHEDKSRVAPGAPRVSTGNNAGNSPRSLVGRFHGAPAAVAKAGTLCRCPGCTEKRAQLAARAIREGAKEP